MDQETRAQLAGIRGKPTSSGRSQVGSKEDARKRGQASPDRAEATVLAFARIVPRHQTVQFNEAVTVSPY
jgi:hypothetical protein